MRRTMRTSQGDSASYMNCNESAPLDPTISNSADPSSPPSLEESQQGSSTLPSGSSGLPRFPQVKLRIKFGGDTPNSVPQIMTSSAHIKYGNNDDDHESDESFQFSGVNAEAVRNSLNSDANGSEANADNDSNADNADPTPSKRERKKTSPFSPSAKKSKKKGRAAKSAKKDPEEEEEKKEDEEDGEEDGDDEVYEVERILAHEWSDDGILRYKVKWVGYGPEYDTFEPEEMLDSAKQRIEEYKRSLPVEDRTALEFGVKLKKKRGRPSKGGKRPRAESPSDASEEEKESDDEDFEDEGKKGKKKTAGRTPTSSTRGSRGRPSKTKGELKLFESPKSTGPPRKREYLESRQGWLNESDSDSDQESKKDSKRGVKKRVTESPAPKKESVGRRGRGATVEETPSTSNVTRHGRGGATAAAGVVEGIYRQENGQVDVVVVEGHAQKIVSLKEAHDIVGFSLVQFLADRMQFQP
ncbi:hypothetical protein PMAYCL1PPCAC_03070 [Pristionchus mayeri]|uniref:Chromo domain-containing protein n=1 Tax=Pristionchus mayeri TaxID=1317129 RepID=A0AAN4Z7Z3_9BILA|nr:hypothetical protein PMAYCL1PPCAC_03070 [Pristionchus mayeri]